MRPLSFPAVVPFWSLWVWGASYRAGDGEAGIVSVRSRQHSLLVDFFYFVQSVYRCSILEMGEEGRGTQPGRRF